MIEMIEVETGFGSCEPMATVRIYATDLVALAKAIKGREYLELCITNGIRRIANINMVVPEPVVALKPASAYTKY